MSSGAEEPLRSFYAVIGRVSLIVGLIRRPSKSTVAILEALKIGPFSATAHRLAPPPYTVFEPRLTRNDDGFKLQIHISDFIY